MDTYVPPILFSFDYRRPRIFSFCCLCLCAHTPLGSLFTVGTRSRIFETRAQVVPARNQHQGTTTADECSYKPRIRSVARMVTYLSAGNKSHSACLCPPAPPRSRHG